MTEFLTHAQRRTILPDSFRDEWSGGNQAFRESFKLKKPYYAREIMPGTGFPAGYLKVFGPDHREIGALERSRALELVNDLNAKDAARATEEAEGDKLVGDRFE